MSRAFDEVEFLKLVKVEEPTIVYYDIYNFFGKKGTFWFYTYDRVKNKLKINCETCIERVAQALRKLDTDLVKVRYTG